MFAKGLNQDLSKRAEPATLQGCGLPPGGALDTSPVSFTF